MPKEQSADPPGSDEGFRDQEFLSNMVRAGYLRPPNPLPSRLLPLTEDQLAVIKALKERWFAILDASPDCGVAAMQRFSELVTKIRDQYPDESFAAAEIAGTIPTDGRPRYTAIDTPDRAIEQFLTNEETTLGIR